MPTEPLVLGFDTSAAHCAAAVLSGERILASRVEDMARGQAERLMPLLQEILAEANADWPDLTRIGVGIGPGNFTGIRISVSAARGLALGLGIPVLGISSFDALRGGNTGPAAVMAPREMAYLQDGTAEPVTMPRAELPNDTNILHPGDNPAEAIARLAATRDPAACPPAPFYLRAPDAAPASDPPPVILDDA